VYAEAHASGGYYSVHQLITVRAVESEHNISRIQAAMWVVAKGASNDSAVGFVAEQIGHRVLGFLLRGRSACLGHMQL
jgi:hypothetical protein